MFAKDALEMEHRMKRQIAELQNQVAGMQHQVRQCRSALKQVNELIAEAAGTGFNCNDGDWAERLFFSQQQTSRALRDTKDVDTV